jgi:hypothetical protein
LRSSGEVVTVWVGFSIGNFSAATLCSTDATERLTKIRGFHDFAF